MPFRRGGRTAQGCTCSNIQPSDVRAFVALPAAIPHTLDKPCRHAQHDVLPARAKAGAPLGAGSHPVFKSENSERQLMTDLAPFLADITADAPAGDNLEFDPDFGALERAAQGKGETQFGDTVMAAEPPDWKDVEVQALALLARTRDLRVLSLLAVTRLQLRGVVGFAGVLSCTRQLLETMWAAIHPQLDPEDDNDPTLRANALLRIGDPGRVLRVLRDLPLASSVRAGRFSWRDIGYATGAIELPEDREKPSEAAIRGAFQETDQAALARLAEALSGAIGDLAGINAVFDGQAGYGSGPDLTELVKLLREMQRYVERYTPVVQVQGEEPAPVDANAAGAQGLPERAVAQNVNALSPSRLMPITTREDAMLLLDLVRAYYERYEPSSPLPLLLNRVRRLSDMSFIDILRDIAPDGLHQAQIVIGAGDN
jgi:type VI secretion system protein ImpA